MSDEGDVEDAERLDHDVPTEDDDWLSSEPEELPPRPRRKLLAPVPLALLAVVLLAGGFLAGVEVEKGQGGTSSSSGSSLAGFASRLRAAAAAAGSGGGSGQAGGGLLGAPGAGGAGAASRPTSGTVSFVSGDTLYVTDGEGGTTKIETSAATTVTKTAKSSVHAIRPGETVTITGATGANGAVHAEAIRVGSSGGLASLFGGGASSGGRTGKSGEGTGGTGGQPLFGG